MGWLAFFAIEGHGGDLKMERSMKSRDEVKLTSLASCAG